MISDINILIFILLVRLSSIILENFNDCALIITDILELIELHAYKFGLVYYPHYIGSNTRLCFVHIQNSNVLMMPRIYQLANRITSVLQHFYLDYVYWDMVLKKLYSLGLFYDYFQISRKFDCGRIPGECSDFCL